MKILVRLILLAGAFVGGYYAGHMPNSPEPLKGLAMICDKIIGATGDAVGNRSSCPTPADAAAPAQPTKAAASHAPAEQPVAAARANVPEVQSVQWAARQTGATTWDQELQRNR